MLPILPDPPSRNDPINFSDRADAFLAALPEWTAAANALEQSLQLVATTGTSTSSLVIGSGSKTLITQAGKAWAIGAFVYLVSASSVANLMIGQVTGYNSTNGSLDLNVVGTSGSGTFTSWVIGLSGSLASAASFATSVTTPMLMLDTNFLMQLLSGNPRLQFDSGDYIWFDRTNNKFGFSVGGTDRLTIDATDGPQRATDATTANGLVRKSQLDAALPVGSIIDFGSETPPTGWLECDGSSLLRAGTYAALFAVLGTAHGAADSTHFNLPDHRGKFKRGWAHGSSADPDRASRSAAATGGASGDHVGSGQGWQVEAHAHYNQFQPITNVEGPDGGRVSGGAGSNISTVGGWSNNTGGNQTNPINAAVMSIIRAVS